GAVRDRPPRGSAVPSALDRGAAIGFVRPGSGEATAAVDPRRAVPGARRRHRLPAPGLARRRPRFRPDASVREPPPARNPAECHPPAAAGGRRGRGTGLALRGYLPLVLLEDPVREPVGEPVLVERWVIGVGAIPDPEFVLEAVAAIFDPPRTGAVRIDVRGERLSLRLPTPGLHGPARGAGRRGDEE